MARASTPTLLALDRWAKIMGIAPPHFNQGATTTVFPAAGTCNDVWWQHPWQRGDRISREDVGSAIAQAEDEIARALGWWPAPVWTLGTKEKKPWPRFYQREVLTYPYNVAGREKSVQTEWGKVIDPGQRATTVLAARSAVVYSDGDGDGYNELATVTVAAGTLTDVREIKVYFQNEGPDPIFEIRPAISKTLTGGNFVLVFYAWQLVPIALWEAFPTTTPAAAIDLMQATSREATVEVYREWNDTTAAGVQFEWSPDLVCAAGCLGQTTQNGTFIVRDYETGLVVPYGADYADGCWSDVGWSGCIEPDRIALWYYSGERSDRFINSVDTDPLSDYWAQTIAWMATARLDRQLCSCSNVASFAAYLREDLTRNTSEGSYTLAEEVMSCPFGAKRGEYMAWKRVDKFGERHISGAAV